MFKAIIVVPCFNEAERLPEDRFIRFAAEHPEIGFWFIDDGSADATQERLEALAHSHPEVFRSHSLSENCGKAEAVRVGMQHAMAEHPQFVGFWDADLATPLESILEFVQFLDARDSCEVVFGARVALAGRDIRRRPVRHYTGRIFATTVSLVLGLSIYDTQCGAKMFRCSETTSVLFKDPFVSRWIFDVEIVARLLQERGPEAFRGSRSVLAEFPLQEWEDVSGSKIRATDFPKALLDLWRIRGHYRLG